jgi:hypothetical protein
MRTLKILLLACATAGLALPAQGQAYIKTPLSKKTKKIKRGWSRERVVELLGPATWAILPTDEGPFSLANYTEIGLELRWDNGPKCLPVTVQFDRDMEVVAVGKGRTCDRDGIDYNLLPTKQYSCESEDRSRYCRQATAGE